MTLELELPGFFKEYYTKVRTSISNDQVQQFAKLKTDEDRVRYCYEKIPAIHEIEIRQFFHGKSERDALDKKDDGNKAFGQKKNVEAIQLYSQAVVKAPVLSGKYWKLIKESADPRKMTLYPICLANRSAALYHNNEYYFCVKDIDEALEHHYPKELKWKLYKRKARVLVDLKRHLDARDSYRQALKWLDWAKVDREKRMEIQKEIQKWLSIFDTGKVVKNRGDWKTKLFPVVPEVTNGPHASLPALSSKVEMRYNPEQGRYAVAAEDIAVGDFVCTEKPYAAVLLQESFGTHCQNCFLVTRAPIPCGTCSGVVFCSSDCRDTAYFHKVECSILDLLRGSGMSINCFLSFRMLSQTPMSFFMNNKDKLKLDEDPESVLKLKPVAKPNENNNSNMVESSDKKDSSIASPETPSTLSSENKTTDSNLNKTETENKENCNKDSQNGNDPNASKQIENYKDLPEEEKQKLIEEDEAMRKKMEEQLLLEEEMEYEKARRRIEEARRKKQEEQKWKEDMFWRIYYLVRHSERRTVEDFIHRTVMACFLLKAIKKTKYFDEYKTSGVGNELKLRDHELLAGGLLLRFTQIIQFNAHEVSEFGMAAPNTVDGAKNLSLGAAIYPTLAYFNHSCHSAQVRYFSGTTVITRTVRSIAKGELIPENYGPCYSSKPKTDRKLQLVDRYWFDCQCEACTEDWPTYANMDENRLKFKCHKCSEPLLVPLDRPNPLYQCNRCGEQTNILGACKNLSNSEKTFKAAVEELNKFDMDKAEVLLQENLVQLDSILCHPFKDYHLTQEYYMKCCLYRGNTRVKKSVLDIKDEDDE